jgi:hypothetical protein
MGAIGPSTRHRSCYVPSPTASRACSPVHMCVEVRDWRDARLSRFRRTRAPVCQQGHRHHKGSTSSESVSQAPRWRHRAVRGLLDLRGEVNADRLATTQPPSRDHHRAFRAERGRQRCTRGWPRWSLSSLDRRRARDSAHSARRPTAEQAAITTHAVGRGRKGLPSDRTRGPQRPAP